MDRRGAWREHPHRLGRRQRHMRHRRLSGGGLGPGVIVVTATARYRRGLPNTGEGMRFRHIIKVVPWFFAASLAAQTPLTRTAAIDAALDRGARLGVAQADTAVASAALITARARPNPSLSASYSQSVPNWHFSADIPIDFPMLR